MLATSTLSLRERNKLAAQRHVQDVAIELFRERGYGDVTVDSIARVAGVSAATVYRYFGSKEGIVSWNESIDQLQQADLNFSSAASPARLLRRVFIETFPAGYDDKRDLNRLKAIFDVPEIFGISAVNDHRSAIRLIEMLTEQYSELDSLVATVLAYSAIAALDAALYQWQLQDGVVPLNVVLGEAFDALEHQWCSTS